MEVRLCSFNVNGLGNRSKRDKIFNWLKQNNFSISLLQELHCTHDNVDIWKQQWGHDIFLSGNSSNSTGIGILLNINSKYENCYTKKIIQGTFANYLKINNK